MTQPRSSAPPEAGAAPEPARLAPAALLRLLGDRVAVSRRCALLTLHLHRSDRLSSLSQEAASREVLMEVLRRIEGMLRPADRYALASHEECWLLLDDPPGEALAELAARTLRSSLSRPVHLGGNSKALAALMQPVIGGVFVPPGTRADPQSLLENASQACDEAESLESRVLIITAASDAELRDRRIIELELRQALQENALDVHFQPQIRLAENRCTGAEALVRWQRENGSWVSPSLIASICETRGLMTQLTLFVLNTALRHLTTWDSEGIKAQVSINLSPVTLADPAFPSLVGHALQTWQIGAERLTLELTETAVVRHEQSALQFMKELREHGCGLALDDFGTGYSSFKYLRRFPLTELKIDQSFVHRLADKDGDRPIVQALVDLSHTFGMQALAEGVEDAATASVLRDLGCEMGQGFHFARPMPAGEFTDWWRVFNREPLRPTAPSPR